MQTSFDTAASKYDATFTHSVIGKLQRGYVYKHLSETLRKGNPKTILEINCGTGEDAIWLAKKDIKIIATDISEEMIAVAKNKGHLKNLQFETADINLLNIQFQDKKFDLVFSNFGGLNCLDRNELALFFKNASEILSEKGQLALVIMPKNTLWEQLYFLLKGNFRTVFRRKKESVIANVDGEKVTTYYFNPKETVNLASDYFDFKQLNPIGLFVPPSYLEPFFKNKKILTSALNTLENAVTDYSFLSRYADHYFIVFQKK